VGSRERSRAVAGRAGGWEDPAVQAAGTSELAAALTAARRGLRSDVARLIDAIDAGELLVPLARTVEGMPEGERVEIDADMTIVPHLIADEAGARFCALFTGAEALATVAQAVGWDTEGASLEYCTLPAHVALHLALDLVDGENVAALVIDAGHDSELVLRREELASIARRRALPLVGYVAAIPASADARRLVAQLDAPPDPALLGAIERCLGAEPGVASWRLEQTFDAERDLEPHPTVTVRTNAVPLDRQAVGGRLAEALEDLLPAPGYVDVLFEEPAA
jgi:hypothetical protein